MIHQRCMPKLPSYAWNHVVANRTTGGPRCFAHRTVNDDKGKTLLFIGAVWPEPTTTAAGIRSLNIINSFTRQGWKVVAGAPSPINTHSERLQALGIDTHPVYPNDPSVDSMLSDLRPDVVVFDRFTTEEKFGWRVAEAVPDCLRVLDTQDLHFLRTARQRAIKAGASLADITAASLAALQPLPALVGPGGIAGLGRGWARGEADAAQAAGHSAAGSGAAGSRVELVGEEALRELAAVLRCDVTLVISSYEMRLLQARFNIPPELLLLTRFHYPPPRLDRNPDFDSRSNLAMIGHFRHVPNVDGLVWFRDHIWPEVKKKLPDVAVHVYGAYPTKEHMALGRKDKAFLVQGPCPDQYDMLRRYRVNLAPLRFGAGIKGKIADGWWCGTPVVTTPIGAEGMHDDADGGLLPFGGSITDHPKEFAERVVELYQDSAQWEGAQHAGYALLEQLYDEESNGHGLVSGIEWAIGNREEARRRNVMGQVLQHHLYRSTKYFSKWIEEKETRLRHEAHGEA